MDTKTLADAHLMNPLEERIGYKFRNSLLLAEALTHASISLERKDYPFDNQRLEFLGDAVLQLVITDELFARFPDSSEGQLTKIRTRLVSRTALKEHAKTLRDIPRIEPKFVTIDGQVAIVMPGDPEWTD